MKQFNSIKVSTAVIFATIAVLSCSSDIELPPPPNEELSRSSSSAAQGVSSGETASSSSSGKAESSSSSHLLAEVSSSSGISDGSSSSIPPVMVFCQLSDGTCPLTLISQDECATFGGTPVQSCAVSSSSSSIVPSSGSVVPPSSSSIVPSSSSVVPSSSSALQSSSSIAPSSSSYGGLCEGFVEGTAREHLGIDKKQFCDERDGKKYVYVKIGTQTWMAENLNYKTPDGTSRCYPTSGSTNASDADNSNCNIYGRLYNWSAAMGLDPSCNTTSCSNQIQSKHTGICPSGWHIPSQAEWNTLSSYVQSTSGCSNCDAKLLKADSSLWNSNGKGTDEFGFSALPGGIGNSAGSFNNVGGYGGWWSASEINRGDAYSRIMNYNNESAYWSSYNKSSLFSVRCLQD